MGRTASELLKDLFDVGTQAETDRLRDILRRQDEKLAEQDFAESIIRAEATTQLFIEAFRRVLVYVREQLEIPADAIGIRTKADGSELLALFASEADGVRRRLKHARNKSLLNLHVKWRNGDDYDRRTANLLTRATANLSDHVDSLVGGIQGQQRETAELWKRIVRVVEGDMSSAAHDIEERAKREVRSLGQRRPRPPREAYDPEHIAGMYMRAMRERIDLIFTTYPNAITKLQLEVVPKELLPLIRLHVQSLVDEAIISYRSLIVAEFEAWGHDVPGDIVVKAVDAAEWSAVSNTETLLATFARGAAADSGGQGTHAAVIDGQRAEPDTSSRDKSTGPVPAQVWTKPLKRKRSKTRGLALKIGGAVLVAAGGVGAYWFEKVQIDRREDTRHQREQARRELITQLTPKLDRALETADSMISILAPPVGPRRRQDVEIRFRDFNQAINSLDSARIVTEGKIDGAFDAVVGQEFRRLKREFTIANTLVRQSIDGKLAFYTPIDTNGRPLGVRRVPVLTPPAALDSADRMIFRLRETEVPAFQRHIVYFHDG